FEEMETGQGEYMCPMSCSSIVIAAAFPDDGEGAVAIAIAQPRREQSSETLWPRGVPRAHDGGPGLGPARRSPYFRWAARRLFIPNRLTRSLPPNTALSLSSATISRLFCGFCRLFFLM